MEWFCVQALARTAKPDTTVDAFARDGSTVRCLNPHRPIALGAGLHTVGFSEARRGRKLVVTSGHVACSDQTGRRRHGGESEVARWRE